MESSSLTRDQTQAPLRWERGVLATGPPGKVLPFLVGGKGETVVVLHMDIRKLLENKCGAASV